MKRIWLCFLANLEDSKILRLIPLFLGMLLLLTAGKISQIVSEYFLGKNIENAVAFVLYETTFVLWGIQGFIFAKHKEFPIIMPALKGKAAMILGMVVGFGCLIIALDVAIINLSR